MKVKAVKVNRAHYFLTDPRKLLKINELQQYSAMKLMFRLYNDSEFKDRILLLNEIYTYNTWQSIKKNICILHFLACKSSNSNTVNCMKM